MPTSYRIQGDSLVQIVHVSAETTFPVVADPSFWKVLKCAGAIAATVASFAVPAGRLVQLRKFVKTVGGIGTAARLLMGATTWAEKRRVIIRTIGATGAQILAIDSVLRTARRFAMTVLQVSYAILLAVGVCAALLAVPHYVRSSWRVRDRDAQALAAALQARRAGTWGALPSRDHGFALHHVLIAWATALVADLAASAAFGEIESIRLVAGRALVGGGAAVSVRYVLAYVGSPATRPTWLRREQVSYVLAALFGVLGGLTEA